MRTAGLLEYLAGRNDLDVITFRQPGAPDPRTSRLSDLTRRLCVLDLPYHRPGPPAKVWRNLGRFIRGVPPLTDRFAGFESQIAAFLGDRQYEVAVVEHFWCAGYGPLLSRHAGQTILDLHNIESVLHDGCAESERWPLSLVHRRFGAACRRLERRLLPGFSRLLAASAADVGRLSALAGGRPVTIYPNTIPHRDLPARSEEEVIAFSGNMEYHPNTSAVGWFASRAWPLLRQRHPNLVWRLIGKNPEAVADLVAGDSRIELTGAVEDAVAELARARVAVVPLLAGSGTRIKIIEAWAAGTPVVSTSIGAEGLGASDGRDLLLADGPHDFARAASRVLDDATLRRRLAVAGRVRYEQDFTWPAGWKELDMLGF